VCAYAQQAARRQTLDLMAAVPVAFARLASSSALKSVALRSTCTQPHHKISQVRQRASIGSARGAKTQCMPRGFAPRRGRERWSSQCGSFKTPKSALEGNRTMELPLTPSISRRFLGLTMPRDDMIKKEFFGEKNSFLAGLVNTREFL